jgi:hypothetical protein
MSSDFPQHPSGALDAQTSPEYLASAGADADLFDRLVTSLYGCVDNNEGFEPFLACIREELGLTSCCLAVIQKEPQLKGLYGWALGYPPGVVPLMLKTGLVFKDEAIARALDAGPSTVFSYADGDPGRDFLAEMSSFSRTWIRAAGIIDSATVAFTNKYQHHVALVLNRHTSNGVRSHISHRAPIALINILFPDAVPGAHRLNQRFPRARKSIQTSIHPLPFPDKIHANPDSAFVAQPKV